MSGSLVGLLILLGCGVASPASARQALDQRRSVPSCTSGHFRPVPNTRCKKYEECVHGQWNAYFECPQDLHFNYDDQTCDWYYRVDLRTCHADYRPEPVPSSPVTTSKPTTHPSLPTTHLSPTTDHYTPCGGKPCYHGTCWFDRDCDYCRHYNHRCNCLPGYSGETCLQHIDPVTSSPTTAMPHHSPELGRWHVCGDLYCYHVSTCSHGCDRTDNYGRCTHYRNNQCTCYKGYTGPTCSLKQVSDGYCNSIGLNCHYHGHCVEDLATSNYACQCSDGYTGDNCQLRIAGDRYCISHGLPCNHGHCVEDLTTSSYTCDCSDGYTGDNCQLRKVDHRECYNSGLQCDQGDCVSDSDYAYHRKHWCNCNYGYTGHNCDQKTSTAPPQTTTTTTVTPTTTTTSTTMAPTTTTTQTTTPSTTTTTASTTTASTTFIAPTTTTVPTTTTEAFSATPYRNLTSGVPTSDITTSTSNSPPQTTTVQIHFYPCNKINTVLDIGKHVMANNSNVASCPSGGTATPEAFVLAHCQTPHPTNWTQGMNVMQQCHSIPLYTPIATFVNSAYSTSGSLSGMLLGCLSDGFKLGVQRCDHAPDIVHIVTGGLFAMNPDAYYTIQ